MKFFFYLKHFPLHDSPCTEGVAKAVHGLATGLVAWGESVTILGEGPVAGVRRSEFGYDICVFPAANTHPSMKLSPDLISYVQGTIQPDDRVILNGIFHRSVAALARLLKRQAIPYIVAPHDPYHPAIFQKNKLLKTVYWWLQEAPMLRSAWGVQILDERHQQYLRARRIKTRTIALPNGFDSADVVPESSLEWRSSGIPRIYFLGRFDTYNKGLDLLVAAIAQVLKVRPVQLTLQGPEWGDREALKAQVQALGIQDHVTFLEPDYQNSPAALALQYDIFTVPSRFEGFSLSALEAMLAGRVIVISEVAGLAPHVEASASGRVVQPTVDSIMTALHQLLDCRDRWPDMGRSGRNYALNELQWKKIAQVALVGYGLTID
jgi:glycosyltransferase involved in cell wall biosynthesis